MLLKNCRFLLTQNEKRDILENVDVLIEGSIIKKIGKDLGKHGKNDTDCSRKIVMPGLVNTHTHLGMHSLRGLCDDAELHDWLDIIVKEEKKLSDKQILENTEAGLREAVRFGTTCMYDSYRLAEERARLFERLGMRGCLSSTIREKKDIAASEKFVKSMLARKSSLIKPVVAAHAIFSTDEAILKEVIALSEKYGVRRRLHVGETRKERFDVQQKTGKLPIEYLDSIGFLDEKALLVHAIWITKGEIRLMAKTRTKVSHNPISNMKLASGGVMPLVEMMQEGVTVGLGTDSVVSNNNLDLFEELKVTPLLHKQHRWDPKVITPQDVLDMATINGAKCLGFDDVGSIEVGKNADIITIDLAPHLLPATTKNIVSHIVYSANGNDVCDSVIDGKMVMKDRIIR
ncbi:amidohydrolase [Candidatus Woesearchaeota archaeon]|nr:amidohydrolase [Candidatus Woesearchaeota archaeon]